MTNAEKYIGVFTTVFGITEEEAKSLEYQGISDWDSVGHMTLVAEIEECFGIEMDADDIIDFSSFEKGKEILEKYNIQC